jgi:hypothetical protein
MCGVRIEMGVVFGMDVIGRMTPSSSSSFRTGSISGGAMVGSSLGSKGVVVGGTVGVLVGLGD